MKEWKKIGHIGANGNEAKGVEKGEDGLSIREVADLCEEEASVNDGVRKGRNYSKVGKVCK